MSREETGAIRHLALAGRMAQGVGVSVTPAPTAFRMSLRAPQESIAALAKALGVALPRKPKTSTTEGSRAALWLGPDEWLVIDEDSDPVADCAASTSCIRPSMCRTETRGSWSRGRKPRMCTRRHPAGPGVDGVFRSGLARGRYFARSRSSCCARPKTRSVSNAGGPSRPMPSISSRMRPATLRREAAGLDRNPLRDPDVVQRTPRTTMSNPRTVRPAVAEAREGKSRKQEASSRSTRGHLSGKRSRFAGERNLTSGSPEGGPKKKK